MFKRPKIKFIISADQDIKNYILFRRYSLPKFLSMFLPTELRYIINEKLTKKAAEDDIRKYVKEKFKIEGKKMMVNKKNIQRQWALIENKYFDLISKIFKNHHWPEGKYIGFASVFNMYPRDVQEKIFYFPGLQENAQFSLATVAHEMLHFIFYDYLKIKYGINEEDKFENKNSQYLWIISETFNLVIETWRPYQKIFKTEGKPYDSAHAKIFPKMKRMWEEKNDIDYLLDYYFKFPKTSNLHKLR